jgi:hypothetical protein
MYYSQGGATVELTEYRVLNFRSINDSGPITVGKTTALVGRNESGKSNLHLALATLKPSGGIKLLNPIKDFPRQRRLAECVDATLVLETKWKLNEVEAKRLSEIWSRAADVCEFTVHRDYKGASYQVGIVPTKGLKLTALAARQAWQPIGGAMTALEAQAEAAHKAALTAARTAVEVCLDEFDASGNPTRIYQAVKSARAAIAATGKALPAVAESSVSMLEDSARADHEDESRHLKAREWVVAQLPTFVLIDEYPEFDGHQDLAAYLVRKS